MSSIDSGPLAPAPRLLDQVRARIRVKRYSIRTEETYGDWIRRFVLHFGKRHPRELGARYVEAFLSDHAVTWRVAASTQNRATAAVLSDSLRTQLELVKLLQRQDLAEGHGAVYLPFALDRKYPGAARECAWQYVVASGNLSVDPRSGVTRRHLIDEKGVQRAMK